MIVNSSCGAWNQQRDGGPHCPNIGAKVKYICGRHQHQDGKKQRSRIILAKISGEPTTGHAPNAATHFLDCCHQWIRQDHRPQQPIAELRTYLRVGRDAARIVV